MIDIYVAGLVDADGSIIISKTMPRYSRRLSPWYRLSVQVTNTHRPVLEMLEEEYGGSVTNKPLTKGSFFTRKSHYNWSVGGKGAFEMLKRLQPHLIIKKEQAELGIKFWEERTVHMGIRPVPADELNLREGFYGAMKALKTV